MPPPSASPQLRTLSDARFKGRILDSLDLPLYLRCSSASATVTPSSEARRIGRDTSLELDLHATLPLAVAPSRPSTALLVGALRQPTSARYDHGQSRNAARRRGRLLPNCAAGLMAWSGDGSVSGRSLRTWQEEIGWLEFSEGLRHPAVRNLERPLLSNTVTLPCLSTQLQLRFTFPSSELANTEMER